MKHLAVALFLLIVTIKADAVVVSCGNFKVVKGKVQYKERSSQKSLFPASANRKICSGGQIVTGPDSRAMVLMPGGEEIHVSPSSQLVIEDLKKDSTSGKKKVLLNLLYGTVRANVPKNSYDNSSEKQFRIKTKTAVAGVRGTQFVASFAPANAVVPDTSTITTLSGTVQVASPAGINGFDFAGSGVYVEAGQQTSISAGTAPAAPQAVPPQEMKQMDDRSSAGSAPAAEPQPDKGAKLDAPAEDKKEEPAPTAERKEKSPERAPASVAAPSAGGALPPPTRPPMMTTSEDLGKLPDGAATTGPLLTLPPLFEPPTAVLPPPVVCEYCNERIVSGKTNVTIKIVLPTQ